MPPSLSGCRGRISARGSTRCPSACPRRAARRRSGCWRRSFPVSATPRSTSYLLARLTCVGNADGARAAALAPSVNRLLPPALGRSGCAPLLGDDVLTAESGHLALDEQLM